MTDVNGEHKKGRPKNARSVELSVLFPTASSFHRAEGAPISTLPPN